MTQPNERTQVQLTLLKQLYNDGDINEATYRAKIQALGLDPESYLDGSGALAQGDSAIALGEKAVQAHDVGGDIVTGTKTITIEGAATGSVAVTNGDFVGRDKTEHHYHGVGSDALNVADLKAAYLMHLMTTVGRLSLSGIDPKAASDTKTKLNLAAVYTGLLTLTSEECTELRRNGCLSDAMEHTGRRLSVVAQLDKYSRLVLLGDPGSGKSTFVNFVALCLAGEILEHAGDSNPSGANIERLTAPLPQEDESRRKKDEAPKRQPWSHGALLPVRVVLRDFAARGLPPVGETATANHLWTFIVAELESAALGDYAPYLKRELLKVGGLLLLDGLDEVPQAEDRRVQIRQAVEDFVGSFGKKCRVLVTSRTYAYQQQEWRLDSFSEAVLAPFSAGQIAYFVDNWYAHLAQLRGMHPGDAEGRAELLKRAIRGSDRLQALAERPLLLTLMASLHAWRGGSLPEKREQLYADTVDLLLDWWEEPKVVRDKDCVIVQQPSLAEWLQVDRDKVRKLLERLAYEAHSGQPDTVGTADIPEDELVKEMLALRRNLDAKPRRLVEYLSQRAGLLLPRGVGVYTFPHRTFQEYMAACYLTDFDYPDYIAGLVREHPNRWREVTLLAGAKAARGTASAVWSLVDSLCFEDIPSSSKLSSPGSWGALLAGQALVESGDLTQVSPRNRVKLERVRSHLVRILQEAPLPAVERVAAGVVLAQLGDPRPGVGLREDGLPDIAWCEVPAGMFIMGSGEDDKQAYDREKPQRRVAVPAFRISKYPVTNAQFAAFVRTGGYEEQRYWTDAGWKQKQSNGWDSARDYGSPYDLPNHPVVGVSWYEAVAYCRWLSEQSGEEISLPSETQWEKAARGTDGRIYPWGAEIDVERLNYEGTGIGSTSAVGCFPSGVSPYGALDMSGNVWEWCRTNWESDYKQYKDDDGLEGSNARVLRGGAFNSSGRYVRCAYRFLNNPGSRNNLSGFRVVAVPFF